MMFVFWGFFFEEDKSNQDMLIVFSAAVSLSNEIKAFSPVRNEYTVSTTMRLHRQNDCYLH